MESITKKVRTAARSGAGRRAVWALCVPLILYSPVSWLRRLATLMADDALEPEVSTRSNAGGALSAGSKDNAGRRPPSSAWRLANGFRIGIMNMFVRSFVGGLLLVEPIDDGTERTCTARRGNQVLIALEDGWLGVVCLSVSARRWIRHAHAVWDQTDERGTLLCICTDGQPIAGSANEQSQPGGE